MHTTLALGLVALAGCGIVACEHRWEGSWILGILVMTFVCCLLIKVPA